MTTTPRTTHRWRFYRAGGLDLVRLETADDFRNLQHLDQKLWTALACPVKGLEFDEKTLALIDDDGDGRVRAPEIIAAVNWVCAMMQDPAAIRQGGDSVPLTNLKDAALLASAKETLASLGKASATAITLSDVTDTSKIFAQTRFNGDGVIPVAAAGGDAKIEQVLLDIIATQGSVPDRSGAPGVNAVKLDAFLADLAAFDAWCRQAETDAKNVLPLGEHTAAALAAIVAVRTKVDDYFARCRLAAFDARAIAAVNRQESEYLAIAAKDMTISAAELAEFPLAHVEPGRPLALQEGLNPAWAAQIDALRVFAIEPALGGSRATLSEKDWAGLKARFICYEAWSGAKAGATVEALGLKRVRELLAASPQAAVAALIAKDQALEPQFNAIANVERLVRFQRDLYRLLLNFVAFSDFYDPKHLAIFQAGTLFLDGRSCELCIRVDGISPLAAMSKAYIAYCNVTRPGTAPMTIAACFTQGDSDYLFVGRHGLFYDRQGRDWDAVITTVVDQPISIRQAFWLPYKKFLRMIEEQTAKRAAAAEAESEKRLSAAAGSAVNADKAAAAAPKKVDVGAVAAIGVAVTGAISALTLILGYVFQLQAWQYPLVFLGIVAVISCPSMIIAALKLRQRTLGPILDGNGWAVNGRVKINIPFGTALTARATLPPGSELTRTDPYAEKKTPWGLYLFILVVLAGSAAWVRWNHNQHGRYFWQPAPPAAVPAPAPAPEAPPPAAPTT